MPNGTWNETIFSAVSGCTQEWIMINISRTDYKLAPGYCKLLPQKIGACNVCWTGSGFRKTVRNDFYWEHGIVVAKE